jgi:hypothetical protein
MPTALPFQIYPRSFVSGCKAVGILVLLLALLQAFLRFGLPAVSSYFVVVHWHGWDLPAAASVIFVIGFGVRYLRLIRRGLDRL